MKKLNLFVVLMLSTFVMYLTGQQAKKYEIRTAYVYKEASLLISKTDLNCSYFITKGISEDIRIIGSTDMDWNKIDHTDRDRMYINKGSSDGVEEGNTYIIIEKGPKITNPLTGKSLGTYYIKKSLATVTCLYEKRAEITLLDGCHPVNIGDYVLLYEPEETLFKRKPRYTRCRLPDSVIEGNVVYSSIFTNGERIHPSTEEYITIDLGKAMVSKGDFLLFYKMVREDLPPIITGIGVVIESQNTNSTAKVLEASEPIVIGYRLMLLEEKDLYLSDKDKIKSRRLLGEEEIPIIEKLEKEEEGLAAGEESLDLNILFDINEKTILDIHKTDLDKVKDFVQNKSEFVIILRGYSCSVGNEEYNLRLSKQRVDNVKKYLMDTFGIDEKFFESYHYGEKEALFDNTSEEERRKNRLVTVQVIGKK